MKFVKTPINGAYIITPEPIKDGRGFFQRMYCATEFADHGLATHWPQCNQSYNHSAGTLRGMHYQKAPWQEAKLVSCVRGQVYDVIVDLRPDSPTYKAWYGVHLSSKNRAMLYVPEDCAHGYLTVFDDSEVYYQVSQTYRKDSEAGISYADPAIGIVWPIEPLIISERDRSHPMWGDHEEVAILQAYED